MRFPAEGLGSGWAEGGGGSWACGGCGGLGVGDAFIRLMTLSESCEMKKS